MTKSAAKRVKVFTVQYCVNSVILHGTTVVAHATGSDYSRSQ